jgi:DNA-binding MarR family transcriptional regulator
MDNITKLPNRAKALEEILDTLHLIAKHMKPAKQHESDINCPVSMPQMQVLFAVYHNDKITVSELANRLGITPGAITQVVDMLIEQNFIERQKSETDKRTVFVAFTKDGKERFLAMKKEHLARLLPLFDALTDDELQTMVNLQKKIVANMLNPKANV